MTFTINIVEFIGGLSGMRIFISRNSHLWAVSGIAAHSFEASLT